MPHDVQDDKSHMAYSAGKTLACDLCIHESLPQSLYVC